MSSTIQSETYDWATTTTPGSSGTDPKGPFTGLQVTVAGTVVVHPYAGPSVGGTVALGSLPVGYIVRFPVRLVDSSSSATVVGLGSPLIRQGT